MTHSEIIKTLIDKRKDLGYSQTELGNMIGLSKAHICNLEKGRHFCTSEKLLEWAKALGFSVIVE